MNYEKYFRFFYGKRNIVYLYSVVLFKKINSMRKIICCVLMVGMLAGANAQDKPKVIKSKIKDVTVFF